MGGASRPPFARRRPPGRKFTTEHTEAAFGRHGKTQKGARCLVLGTWCLVPGAAILRAWSGGFDETAAPPSNGLTAEHEMTRKPFGTRKAGDSHRRHGTVSCPPKAVFVSGPAGEPKGFSVLQCPPKAASVCSVAKTLGTCGDGGGNDHRRRRSDLRPTLKDTEGAWCEVPRARCLGATVSELAEWFRCGTRQHTCRRGAACPREADLAGGAVAGASPFGVSSKPPGPAPERRLVATV